MKWEVIDDAHETDMNNKITIWIWTILRYDKYKFNQMKMSSYNRTWFVNEIFYNHFSCSMHNILLLLWFGCLLLGFVRWTENKLRELCIQMIWIIRFVSDNSVTFNSASIFVSTTRWECCECARRTPEDPSPHTKGDFIFHCYTLFTISCAVRRTCISVKCAIRTS